ncbi:hypothetical protein [Botrimarina sp.]|uniref:hypothetical protein n=1 Tax=Botrimarina sp. TaxID=2795802 RepID=UPI0032EADE1E
MTTIRVQCETCRAKLRVRDEGFLGEVHACPRCGSMVLIAPGGAAPSESALPSAGTTAALSNTLEALDDGLDTELNQGPASGDPPDSIAQSPATDGAGADLPTETDAATPTAAETTGGLAAWAPLATAGVALAATAAVLVLWAFQTWARRDASASGGESSAAASADVLPSSVSDAAESQRPGPEEEALAASDSRPVDLSADTAAPDPPPPEAALPDAPPSSPTDERPDADQPERVALADRPAPARDEPDATPPPTDDAEPMAIDPLAIDPLEAELILRRTPGDNSPTDDTPADAVALDGAASGEVDLQAPLSPEAELDQRLARVASGQGIWLQRGPTDETTGPPTADAAQRLASLSPAMELRGVPLSAAVGLVRDLSGVPVALSPAALRRAATGADTEIDLVSDNEPLGDVLADALSRSRLAYATSGPYAVVTRQGVDGSKSITHQVGDLVGDEPSRLAEWLTELTPLADPATIDTDGRLTLAAPLATHYDLVVLCERLRLARGGAPATKYPRELLTAEPALLAAAPVLDRRTTFSFVEPATLAELFDHFERVTGRPFLVDWPALGELGLGPRSRVACSVVNRPWRAALDGVLGPLGLSWDATPLGPLVVSTGAPSPDWRRTDFYPVPQEEAQRLAERLPGGAATAYDAASGTLGVHGGPAVHQAVWAALRRAP